MSRDRSRRRSDALIQEQTASSWGTRIFTANARQLSACWSAVPRDLVFVRQELGERAVDFHRRSRFCAASAVASDPLGKVCELLFPARRRQEGFLQRRRVEDVVLRVGLHEPFSFGAARSSSLLKDRQRLVEPSHAKRDQAQ